LEAILVAGSPNPLAPFPEGKGERGGQGLRVIMKKIVTGQKVRTSKLQWAKELRGKMTEEERIYGNTFGPIK